MAVVVVMNVSYCCENNGGTGRIFVMHFRQHAFYMAPTCLLYFLQVCVCFFFFNSVEVFKYFIEKEHA